VLPTSARRLAADLLPGFKLEFSEAIDNAFDGTSIAFCCSRPLESPCNHHTRFTQTGKGYSAVQ
jgi:hypothetical protein